MSGTLAVAMSNPYGRDGDNKITLDWISTAGGAVSVAIASQFSTTELAKGYPGTPQPPKLTGFVTRIETIPGLNGDKATSLPTASYDLTLDDAYGSVFIASDLSGTVAEVYVCDPPKPIDEDITLSISNAGDSKKGRVIIYISKER